MSKLGLRMMLTFWLTAFASSQMPVGHTKPVNAISALGEFDIANVQSRWVVTKIARDGNATPAQFGQKVGDEITFTDKMSNGWAVT